MIILIAVTEKHVVITDNFNPNPITGRQSIFNKVQAPTEMKAEIEIVGVYSKLETAGEARAAHAAAHPGRRYIQKVAQLDSHMPAPVPEAVCVRCRNEGRHTPIGPVGSFCPPCQKKHYDECNNLDPRGGEGDVVPVRQTTFGWQSTLMNTGA